jgi:hypothetical protein
MFSATFSFEESPTCPVCLPLFPAQHCSDYKGISFHKPGQADVPAVKEEVIWPFDGKVQSRKGPAKSMPQVFIMSRP